MGIGLVELGPSNLTAKFTSSLGSVFQKLPILWQSGKKWYTVSCKFVMTKTYRSDRALKIFLNNNKRVVLFKVGFLSMKRNTRNFTKTLLFIFHHGRAHDAFSYEKQAVCREIFFWEKIIQLQVLMTENMKWKWFLFLPFSLSPFVRKNGRENIRNKRKGGGPVWEVVIFIFVFCLLCSLVHTSSHLLQLTHALLCVII